jgi:DNA-binding transcriptional LysR family regulator
MGRHTDLCSEYNRLLNRIRNMRAPKVTLDQWRTLQAVVDNGGYAQAAEALHKSQSSISYAVSKLQEQLGMELLHIDGRKAVLTAAGESLLQRSRVLLDQAIELELVAQNLGQDWEAEVKIAVEAILPRSIIINALKQFLPISKGCKVVVREEVLSGVSEAILEKKVELAIGPTVPPGFMGEKLMDVNFVPVAHPDHKLHHLAHKVSMKDLSEHTHIVIKDSGIKQNKDSGWLGANLRWTVSNLESAKDFLTAGLGFSWIPIHEAFALINSGKLKVIELDVEYQKQGTLFLMYANKDISGQATQLLADLIKQCTKQYLSTEQIAL